MCDWWSGYGNPLAHLELVNWKDVVNVVDGFILYYTTSTSTLYLHGECLGEYEYL